MKNEKKKGLLRPGSGNSWHGVGRFKVQFYVPNKNKINKLHRKKEKGLIKQVIPGILFCSLCFQAIGMIQWLARDNMR